MPGARRKRKGQTEVGPNKEINRGSAGRDGNGVQTYDGRANTAAGEGAGQPKNPGPGATQVKTED